MSYNLDDDFYLEILKRIWKTEGLEYINENIFVNSQTMEHVCNPKALINEHWNKLGVSYTCIMDPRILNKYVGTLLSPKDLRCNKCLKEVSKKTVMVALLKGKGEKWVG